MHDAAKVVDLSQRVHLIWLHLQEVILLSCSDPHSQHMECKYVYIRICVKFSGLYLAGCCL